MTKMIKYKTVFLFALLILLTVGYIWSNSFASVEQSSAQSAPVAETIQSVVDPLQQIEKPVFHDFVRKLAHVVEFFALGVFAAGFAVSLGAYLKKTLVSMPILLVLSVAVIDEYIQHFTKRGSLVTDVVLDFAGALAGLGCAWLLFWLWRYIKMRKEHAV